MRYDVIGIRDDGPVGVLWDWLKTGCCFVVLPDQCTKRKLVLVGPIYLPPIPFNSIIIELTDDPEYWDVTVHYNVEVDWPVFIFGDAYGKMSVSNCGSDIVAVVSNPIDIISEPQFIQLNPVPWYREPMYPVGG